MTDRTFARSSEVPASADALFAWHLRRGAFERMLPPWEDARLVSDDGGLRDGARWVVSASAPPFVPDRWTVEIRDVRPPGADGAPGGFRDAQVRGPFARWEHEHRMTAAGAGASVLEDRIHCALPFGALGEAVGRRWLERRLDRMFAYRHAVLRADLAQAARLRGGTPMRVLVTGASGLVGSALVPLLTSSGHEVVRAVRRAPGDGEAAWDPAAGRMDAAALAGVDAVVHLAGENIAASRWSAATKRRIRESRVDGTALVARTLAAMPRPPRVLVQASAVGFYGDRGDEVLDETAVRGKGFLPDVCEAWERAADPARDAGVRVVLLRTGVVLSPRGGALAKMLTPFRLGVGGVVGSGRQWMPWISIDDLAAVVLHALATESLAGPVNAVAPAPVTNREFTKTLGRVLGRPTVFPVPAFAARLAFGEMADALLLSSARAVPSALQGSGYAFRHATLEAALRHVLGR